MDKFGRDERLGMEVRGRMMEERGMRGGILYRDLKGQSPHYQKDIERHCVGYPLALISKDCERVKSCKSQRLFPSNRSPLPA
jgi:hypothetical protein